MIRRSSAAKKKKRRAGRGLRGAAERHQEQAQLYLNMLEHHLDLAKRAIEDRSCYEAVEHAFNIKYFLTSAGQHIYELPSGSPNRKALENRLSRLAAKTDEVQDFVLDRCVLPRPRN